jgi:hypothetical protein
MPVDNLIDEVSKGLISGSGQIIIGAIGTAHIFDDIVDK